MMFAVTYSSKVFKELEKLDRHTAAIIYGWIDKNLVGCENPRLYGKPLIGDKGGYWRYRIGDYRIIADIQDDLVVIEIIRVGHRREVYRD